MRNRDELHRHAHRAATLVRDATAFYMLPFCWKMIQIDNSNNNKKINAN